MKLTLILISPFKHWKKFFGVSLSKTINDLFVEVRRRRLPNELLYRHGLLVKKSLSLQCLALAN